MKEVKMVILEACCVFECFSPFVRPIRHEKRVTLQLCKQHITYGRTRLRRVKGQLGHLVSYLSLKWGICLWTVTSCKFCPA